MKNGPPGLVIRQSNIHDQSPFESGTETLIQNFHILRRFIGRYDNLFVCTVKAVEGVEKFLLCGFLSYNKLNIINEKDINVTVFLAEFTHGGVISITDGLDQLIGKFFTCNIENLTVIIIFNNKVGDGMHKMGLAKSCTTIDKQRIVRISRRFRYCQGCSLSQFVVAAHDKSIECIFGVQICFFTSGLKTVVLIRCSVGNGFLRRDVFWKDKFHFAVGHSGNFAYGNLQRQFVILINVA